jgi:DNA replication and repair protein RecF
VQLNKLRVFQYRNLSDQEIALSGGTNLFAGLNGQGKTNLLEAIYLLAYGKSFRTSTPRECIRHGEKECRSEGLVVQGTLERKLQVAITAGEKRLLLHGKRVGLDEFAGNLHALAFTQDHLRIVRGAPADRRAFLDRAMITLIPGHLRRLAAYGRALKQRNRVLSEACSRGVHADENLLRSWDETLITDGSRILAHRLNYAEQMKSALPPGLFGNDVLKLHYLSTIPAGGEDLGTLEETFARRLSDSRAADVKTGFTHVGPHRDDLKMFLNGKSLVDFGSSGQQRSALLSLYFAQLEIHQQNQGFYPLFLMDDVEAELDDQRLHSFLAYLSERTQVILTSAKDSILPSIPGEIRRFQVHSGIVESD